MSTQTSRADVPRSETGWADPTIQARTAGHEFTRPQSEMERMICDYPAASIVTGFGAGCAVGLLLANLFTKSSTSSRRKSQREHRQAAEQLGQEIFESIARSLPESLCARISPQ
jgi:hypothetical protein